MAEYGGHDCKFIGAISDRLNCNICAKVLRDPHLAVCCGQHFCESCLNKWFTRQGKESCPHCRFQGEGFHHVINKGLRSEVNQLKIKCSNHGEGCQWTGELGTLKQHLESDNGCDFVMVVCPNKCKSIIDPFRVKIMRRRDLADHLARFCYLRPYQCEFCGLKNTYEAITGNNFEVNIKFNEDVYCGHQAECPDVPLTCPNKCGVKKIKRKDMEGHRTQCPQELVECPFAEAGCKVNVRRQLEDHITTSLQQHLMLLMVDRERLKREWKEMKTELNEVKAKLSQVETSFHEAETRLAFCEAFNNPTNKLKKPGDSMKVTMSGFSEYRRSGKVWHSLPFYYRGGYKMCLAVYANGVGEGAGTHISVALFHLRGEYDNQLKWPIECDILHILCHRRDSYWPGFSVCSLYEYPPINEHVQIGCRDKFCYLNDKKILHMVNDCLTFQVKHSGCYLAVEIL